MTRITQILTLECPEHSCTAYDDLHQWSWRDYVARRNMEAGCEMHGREGRGRLSGSVVAVVSVLACIAMLAGLVMGTTHAVGWVFDAIALASPQHRPIVIAHRGDTRHAPENSLASIRAAKQNGADFAEIDVRLTKDGIPVVFHDRRTGRLDAGGRDVLVNSMPLSALQRMIMRQRGMRYSVPTLRQALGDASMSRPGQRRFGLLLDIKTDARYARKVADAVVRVVEDSKYAGNLMVMSANPYAVMVFKSMRPQWHVGLCASGRPDLTQWDDDGTSEARFMDGAARVETVRREVTAKRGGKQRKHPMFRGMRGEAMDFVVFRTRDVTSRLLRNARLRRIPVYVDSVDSYDAANGLLRHGVSGLLGENITPLQQACSSYHGLPEPFSSPDDDDRSQA